MCVGKKNRCNGSRFSPLVNRKAQRKTMHWALYFFAATTVYFKYCRSTNLRVCLSYQFIYANPLFLAKFAKFCLLLMFLYLQGSLANSDGKKAIAVKICLLIVFISFITTFVIEKRVYSTPKKKRPL